MPKAYWIVHVSVHDPERYPEYLAVAIPVFEKFGANFIVRGGAYEVMEGTERERNFVIEFRDRATAMACYRSPEYQRVVANFVGHSYIYLSYWRDWRSSFS